MLPDHVQLYPPQNVDRFVLWVGIVGLSIGIPVLIVSGLGSIYGWWCMVSGSFSISIAYFFQSEPTEHSEIIAQLDSVQSALGKLNDYIGRERSRLEETKKTVDALTSQREKLKPIVETSRETIDAILTAHSEANRRSVWKDRVIGIVLGIIASIVAALILKYFNIDIT